ncbi:acetyltransferase [Deltaproteobacteria bacterium]|nr:acetyltransferase [Deltaproteobacteria bacterium]
MMIDSGDKEDVLVFGASGHAKVVIDCIEKQGVYKVAYLADDDLDLKGQVFFGYKIIGGRQELLSFATAPRFAIVAIGDNAIRNELSCWLVKNGFELVSAVHPMSSVARNVAVGAGTVVMAGAVINSDSQLGKNVIVNTCASVDHDCMIADGVHLAPGSTLCGAVVVGEESFVCAGATIGPNLHIGQRVVVGAGAAVIRDIQSDLTVVGVPAVRTDQC